MATSEIYKQIQTGLLEKRQALDGFLETASKAEKDMRLCEDETGMIEHLNVIDTSLGKLGEGNLGICEVCHGHVDSTLLEMDYTACVCLDHYSTDELRRLESELELSQVVQRALLPQKAPVIPRVDIAAFSRPAEIVGGDYFDFFNFRDGSHGLVIADVSGHGFSAGMLMSGLQTALRTIAPDVDSPAEILERINHFYIHNIHFTTFVTVFLARFDPASLTLTYVNAGHNPPAFHQRRSNKLHWLMPTGPAIGLSEVFRPETRSVTLSSGDVLLLYTDGLTEVSNSVKEQYGFDRLADFLLQNIDLKVSEVLQAVLQTITAFGANTPLVDDVTMIAMKITD